jgi:alpha-tubulin suppressor-like RCC1 family protein
LLPGLFGGLEWDVAYLADGLVLSVVDRLGDVQAVGAGRNFTCALDTGGRTYCWGVNDWGQVGSGALGDTIPEPRRVDTAPTFAELDAHGETVCGLTAGGDVYCWGATFEATLSERGRVTSPTLVPGGITFQTLSLGFNHACGMDTQGVARCWGVNSDGRLGDGTTEDRESPVPVLPGQAGEPLVSVTAGFLHSCGTNADGMPYCWGRASLGVLGNASSSGGVTEPNLVASQELFSHVEAAGVFTCGLTTEQVPHCWGNNRTGQLGDGSTTDRDVPVSVAIQFPLESLALPTENSIWLHACGLTSGGDAHCWGWNQLGQLGGESSDLCTADDWDCSTVAIPAAPGFTFTSMAGGQAHTCGVTPANELYCWGSNQFWQLGLETQETCQQGENDVPCAREPQRVAPQEP